ncbi:MAG: peptide deformylase [Treponemataceae bacterium]|nr:peptide deformylase [Treponemataceae bacterium]
MVLDVVTLPSELLREKSVPVTEINDEIRQLIADMFETMYATDGVGLAAVQVGKLLRLFVLDDQSGHKMAFINPQIIATSNETCDIDEGCLSIPKLSETITRPVKVTVQALNESGKPFTVEADDYFARIIQHEYDHLDGILYIDRGDQDLRQKIIDTFIKREARRQEKAKAKAAKAARLQAKLAAKGKK